MARTKGATADKFWADAVRLAIHRETQDDNGRKKKRLNILADKLCQMALEGDMQAIREIGDRLDGKPAQAVDMRGELDVAVTKVTREIVSPKNED